ncbi:MAG TPA: phospholipase D-like domain-containing protein [Woeseiaceae bacterium]|nr:phospholipase D-like domain-containing protein [Woeseiaceae bacterium]
MSTKIRAEPILAYPPNIADLDELAPYRTALESALGMAATAGNKVDILQNGEQIFPAMLEAIGGARDRVDFLTYVYWTGDIARKFAGALAAKARSGVSVNVLLDAFGCKKMPAQLVEELQASGVNLRWFRPLSRWRFWQNDNRTHRKILVVDNCIGFTGGVGIADEWTGGGQDPNHWRDTHFRFEGAAVMGLKAAFLDNWNEAGPWEQDDLPDQTQYRERGIDVQVVRASSTIGWTETASLLRALLSVARDSLQIVTPYFVPDPGLQHLLSDAAARGVQVEIMFPGEHCDMRLSQLAGHKSVLPLLEHGARIWRYERTMLHTKLVLVDNIVACVGSANFNHRSLGKDEECCAVLYSRATTRRLIEAFREDQQYASELRASSWQNRGSWLKCQESLARLLLHEL